MGDHYGAIVLSVLLSGSCSSLEATEEHLPQGDMAGSAPLVATAANKTVEIRGASGIAIRGDEGALGRAPRV